MNFIGFPHYTCGGLLCDIFNKTFSEIAPNGGINSISHSLGKIGDSASIFDQYDSQEFKNMIKNLNVDSDTWIGSHCRPTNDDLKLFDQVLLITTTTFRSKLYRWARAYHHYYTNSQPWTEKFGQDRIDKERETAKNYLKSYLPVYAENVINIEFAEVVEISKEFQDLVQKFDFAPHLARWQQLNKFLYDSTFWTTDLVRRFYEAEYETQLKKFYLYA